MLIVTQIQYYRVNYEYDWELCNDRLQVKEGTMKEIHQLKISATFDCSF